MKTKEEVYVVVDSDKKKKNFKDSIKQFGMKIYPSDEYKEVFSFNSVWWVSYVNGIGRNTKTKVSIKELRNILAAEYLKEGDVIVCYIGSIEHTVLFDKFTRSGLIEGRYYTDAGLTKSTGYFGWFLRYATEEEKVLLNPVEEKKELEVGKWYKHQNKGLAYFKDKFSGYGFDNLYHWYCGKHTSTLDSGRWKEASEKEVKQALQRECVKRYGKDWRNVKIKAHADGTEWQWRGLNIGKFESGVLSECNAYSVNGVLYDKGQWADSLPEDNTITDKDILTLERLHDTLHNNHGYTLESRLLIEARKVIDKLKP